MVFLINFKNNLKIKVRETKDEGIINTSMENLSTKTRSIGNYE